MINLKLIETNFDEFNAKLKAKKVDEGVLKNLLDTYNELKIKKQELENLQAVQNAKSKEVGILARSGADTTLLKTELEENKRLMQTASNLVSELETKLDMVASRVPNVIDDDVPLGKDEDDNVCIKTVLEPREFSFTPKEHFELGENLGWLDFATGAKL
ncbi:MAG: serine--tRNA ligase, partial [Campylobacter hyointestinalis]